MLANTRPLQVAKLCGEGTGQENAKVQFAQLVVNEKIVFFVDKTLKWRNMTKVSTYCKCTTSEKQKNKYIYFGALEDQRQTSRGKFFRVSQTMSIGHEIGCLLERWVRLNGLRQIFDCNVALDISVKIKGRRKEKKQGIDVGLLHNAVRNNYEHLYKHGDSL